MIVITELHGLRNNSDSVGDSAKSAMIAINKVITERKDFRITTKKSDATKTSLLIEKLERDEDDDIIIRTTRDQSEAQRQAFTEKNIIGLNGADSTHRRHQY